MTSTADPGLLDAALAALLRLAAADRDVPGAEPADLPVLDRERGELTALRATRPEHRVRLLHQHEALDDSTARALLLTGPDGGCVSLSWTPPSTVPWVLRGAQRSSETVLLSVDGLPMSVEDAMAHLDVFWEETALLDRLVNAAVVRRELDEEPVDLTPAELARAVDAFRRARGLLTAVETAEWLQQRGWGVAELERTARWEAELYGLRERVTAGQVPAWLAAHPDAGRSVTAAVATVSDVDLAEALEAGAQSSSLGAAAADMARAGSTLRYTVDRTTSGMLPGDAVLQAGALWRTGCTVVEVLEVSAPDPTRAAAEARDALFDAWLRHRRSQARVRWGWGDTARTAAVDGVADLR